MRQLFDQFASAKILCIGDVMLDTFVYGSSKRISPEAPVPVLKVEHEEAMLGGAGNVVRNLLGLGAEVHFCSVVGEGDGGVDILKLWKKLEGKAEPYILTEKGRTTPRKTRFIAQHQQLLRVDEETTEPISEAIEVKLISLMHDLVEECDAMILSDYAKGLLTPIFTQAIIEAARQANKPVIVDPKQTDFAFYAGATCITPNRKELEVASGMTCDSDDAIIKAARHLMQKHSLQSMLVTRSEQGLSYITAEDAGHIPAEVREVFDVSGAGDTVIATLATALACKASLADAAMLANAAGQIAVSRFGTSAIQLSDLKARLLTSEVNETRNKILPREDAIKQVTRWREAGLKIGFTNGCFDLIHPGHISLLQQAKAQCDRLVVAINSDNSVKRLKGEERPLQPEAARGLVLASIGCVDAVTIFGEDTPLELLELLKPDVLIKGADYKLEEVVGRDLVESYGGQIYLAQLEDGQSTTNLVKKMRA